MRREHLDTLIQRTITMNDVRKEWEQRCIIIVRLNSMNEMDKYYCTFSKTLAILLCSVGCVGTIQLLLSSDVTIDYQCWASYVKQVISY